jgi:AcrR family transcriptional regulator
MPRQRPKKGERRIDAAIDHFTPMGYATADVRAVVKKLLQVVSSIPPPS